MPNKIRYLQIMLLLPGFLNFLIFCLKRRFFRISVNVKSPGNYKRVLIVKLDAIGDFILWLDVAKELRKVYPPNEYEITLLGNKLWTDLAKSLPYFDEVLDIDRNSFFKQTSNFNKLLEKIYSVKFDVVLHPVYSREFLFGDVFVLACDAKQKIGMQGDGINLSWWQKRIGALFYTDLIPKLINQVNELEHNALLLRWLGLADFKAGIPNLRGVIELTSLRLADDFFLVIPGAGAHLRMWPTSNFVALIEKVHSLTGLTAVICGSQAEEKLGLAIEMGTVAPIINLIGQTSIVEFAAVVAKARFIIANETGAVHIAAVFGAPAVCIVGGGHFGRFIPYGSGIGTQKKYSVPVFKRMECFGCNWECLHHLKAGGVAPCIEAVSLEMALSAIMAILEHQMDSR